MKSRFLLLPLIATFFVVASPALAAPRVMLDGRELFFDVPPEINSGRILVPMRAVFEALGATVDWDGAARTVAAKMDQKTMTVDFKPVDASGRLNLSTKICAKIVGGRALVSVCIVSEMFNVKVKWDARIETVTINTKETSVPQTVYKELQDSNRERGELLPVRLNGKWGYIDSTGNLVIAPHFDYAGPFSEGLAAVQIGDLYGYINPAGKVVISPQFHFCGDFSDGLAAVTPNYERTVFIDKTGKVAFDTEFISAGSFKDGLAPVQAAINGKWGYIDRTGKIVIPPQFDYARNFSEGLAQVLVSGKVGFVDTTGRYLIKPQFEDRVGDFSEGLACVGVGCDYAGCRKWGYIDKTGEWVIKPEFTGATSFSEGLAAVVDSYDKWGEHWVYIDKTGEVVINPEFKDVAIVQPGRFSEGLAVQWVHAKAPGIDERWGYIDKNGKMVIEPQFQKAYDFKNGLAFVRADCFDRPKCGYIDKTGQFVWTPTD